MAEETTALDTQEAAEAADAPEGAATAEDPAAEGPRTYTREEVDAEIAKAVEGAVKNRVNRANAKHKKDADALAARNGELEGRVADLEAELSDYRKREQASAWAAKVSEETGVPAEALRGGTEDEMRTHAEALKPYISKRTAPYVGSDGFAAEAPGKDGPDWLRAAMTKAS